MQGKRRKNPRCTTGFPAASVCTEVHIPLHQGRSCIATLVENLAAMVGSTRHKPLAGTCGTNQPDTVSYAQYAEKQLAKMVTRHADAGRHKKVARGQNRLDNYCSGDIELRVAGPGSAYVSIGLLLERDKIAAAKRDPSNVHRYVEASRRGQCVVIDEK
jgi:hypothetical protein